MRPRQLTRHCDAGPGAAAGERVTVKDLAPCCTQRARIRRPSLLFAELPVVSVVLLVRFVSPLMSCRLGARLRNQTILLQDFQACKADMLHGAFGNSCPRSVLKPAGSTSTQHQSLGAVAMRFLCPVGQFWPDAWVSGQHLADRARQQLFAVRQLPRLRCCSLTVRICKVPANFGSWLSSSCPDAGSGGWGLEGAPSQPPRSSSPRSRSTAWASWRNKRWRERPVHCVWMDHLAAWLDRQRASAIRASVPAYEGC